jgi:hypothetical protein
LYERSQARKAGVDSSLLKTGPDLRWNCVEVRVDRAVKLREGLLDILATPEQAYLTEEYLARFDAMNEQLVVTSRKASQYGINAKSEEQVLHIPY